MIFKQEYLTIKLFMKPILIAHILYLLQHLYPVNVLRNRVQDSVNAEYVFYIDVDFVPSPGLYSRLLQKLDLGVLGHKQACILKCMVGVITFKDTLEANQRKR